MHQTAICYLCLIQSSLFSVALLHHPSTYVAGCLLLRLMGFQLAFENYNMCPDDYMCNYILKRSTESRHCSQAFQRNRKQLKSSIPLPFHHHSLRHALFQWRMKVKSPQVRWVCAIASCMNVFIILMQYLYVGRESCLVEPTGAEGYLSPPNPDLLESSSDVSSVAPTRPTSAASLHDYHFGMSSEETEPCAANSPVTGFETSQSSAKTDVSPIYLYSCCSYCLKNRVYYMCCSMCYLIRPMGFCNF